MKKIASLLMMATVALMCVSLTSCDEDYDIAYTLEGTWKGNMYVTSQDNGVTYSATYSELYFAQDPYTYSSGDGVWIDYYSQAPWDYVANHTRWSVNNGVITIYLIEEGYTVQIMNYRLNDGYFSGTIYDHGSYIDFSLRHTSSPNWNNYNWGYGWYAKQGVMDEETRAGQAKQMPVRSFKK